MHTRRAHAPGTHTVHARRTVHARLGPTLEAQLARRANAVPSKPARHSARANALTTRQCAPRTCREETLHTRRAHAPGTYTLHARRTVHARLGPTLEAQLARRANAVHSKPARQRVRANSLTKVALTGGVDRSYHLVVRHAQGRARARKLEASCHLR